MHKNTSMIPITDFSGEPIIIMMICHFREFIDAQIRNPFFFIPKLVQMFPNLSGYNSLKKGMTRIGQRFRQIIQEYMDESDTTVQTNNYLTAYIEKMKNCEDPSSSFYQEKGSK